MDRRSWLIQKCRGVLDGSLPKVLDVGSANGWVFRGTGIRTVSVDLEVYKMPFFVRADAEHLPFKDKSFTVAVLGEILEHVENPVEVLKEANRVGNNILATVPIEHEWDKKHKPFWTVEQRLQEQNLTLEESVRMANPGVVQLCECDDLKHCYHQRYYTDELLNQHLKEAAVIENVKIEPLRYDGWSFRLVQAPVKESEIPLYKKYLLGLIKEGKQPLK